MFCCGGVGEVEVDQRCVARAPAKTKNTTLQRAYEVMAEYLGKCRPLYSVQSSFHYGLHDTSLISLASPVQPSMSPLTQHTSAYPKKEQRKLNTTTTILIRTQGLPQKPQKNQPPLRGTLDTSTSSTGRKLTSSSFYITA